ncbi:MAG: hypothetical protein AAGI37_21555, partial [Planctomycetota bacterium]
EGGEEVASPGSREPSHLSRNGRRKDGPCTKEIGKGGSPPAAPVLEDIGHPHAPGLKRDKPPTRCERGGHDCGQPFGELHVRARPEPKPGRWTPIFHSLSWDLRQRRSSSA